MLHASAYDRFQQPSLMDEIRAERLAAEAEDVRDIIVFEDEALQLVPEHGQPAEMSCYVSGQFKIDGYGNIVAIRVARAGVFPVRRTTDPKHFVDITTTGAFEMFASSLRISHATAIAEAVHELQFEWDGQI